MRDFVHKGVLRYASIIRNIIFCEGTSVFENTSVTKNTLHRVPTLLYHQMMNPSLELLWKKNGDITVSNQNAWVNFFFLKPQK